MVGIPHAGCLRHPTLPDLLRAAWPQARLAGGWSLRLQPTCDRVLVWGRKPSARRGERLAARRGLPLWRLEDAFLRSLAPGSDPPLGLVLDDQGIYYDSGAPSRLEQLIAQPRSTGRVPLRGVKAEARFPCAESEQGGMTGCHS